MVWGDLLQTSLVFKCLFAWAWSNLKPVQLLSPWILAAFVNQVLKIRARVVILRGSNFSDTQWALLILW